MANKVILTGNLGAAPESRALPGGGMVTRVRLATTRRWKDRNTNERKEETEWHRVVFFGKPAETAAQYLQKGSKIYVEGRLRTSKYQKDGQDHFSTEIIVSEFEMLDKAGSGGTAPMTDAPTPSYNGDAPSTINDNMYDNFGDDTGLDDDIPF